MKCCVLVLVSKRCLPRKMCTQSTDLLVSVSVAQSASVMIVISSTQSCCSKIQTTCGCVWMYLARCFNRASANHGRLGHVLHDATCGDLRLGALQRVVEHGSSG